MRFDWFGLRLGSGVRAALCCLGLSVGLGFGCQAGNECGNVQKKCEAQCGGTAADNVCFTYLCSEEQLVCYCKPCQNIPRDMSAAIDLHEKD